ncbi:hypothetical protein [Sporosarcina sp. HYO08]|uniref:hypothetical protein n=1 Tax=Sporosarcina sp. HYO08 TaxID=1759557 RepID=UPI000793DF73|nr:hypothetical protein [Sporosarcina sp. HYO08]KXH83775.1 hypothetical protein AU377_03130 [Sporosarcina sp. HYO08]
MERKRVFTADDRKDADGPYMDNPENLRSAKESIYDMHEDMQTVDAIPLEDKRLELEEEKIHYDTKTRSSTIEKFPGSGIRAEDLGES